MCPTYRDLAGALCTPPDKINNCFVSFYRSLYSFRAAYAHDELTSYLGPIDTPVLTVKYRKALNAPITIDEILKALKTLQLGKTPGPDGIPVEFYKQYAEELKSKLLAMLMELQRVEELPNSE